MSDLPVPAGYATWLSDLKVRIAGARHRAILVANESLIGIYHELGAEILQRRRDQGWGAKVIDRLSVDLRAAFPDMGGWSPRNLKYMQFFADQCHSLSIGQQPVAQLPWGHLIVLLTKLDDDATRAWYAAQVLSQGWNRGTLEAAIRRHAHRAIGAAPTNFSTQLPPNLANAAQAVLKDPYAFEFLGLGDDAKEMAIENAMLAKIEAFLMEMGRGFAFVGRQVDLEVGGDAFRVDLLLYHLRLHCYVVIELKAEDFKPAHTGQLSFYVTTVERHFRTLSDAPTLGLLLCKAKNDAVVEYALANIHAPMGVSTYNLNESLPALLTDALPSVEALELALAEIPAIPEQEP